MPAKRYPVQLTDQERRQLQKYVTQGKKSARAINRARILLLAHDQTLDEDISQVLGVDRTTIYRVCRAYAAGGVQTALEDKPRSGAPTKIDGRVEATLTMLACSDPPEGYARWTLQLLAEKLVKLDVLDSISLPTISTALKKMNSNRG